MSYKERYGQWLNDEFFDEATRKELEAITDEKEIEDRFYRDLEFGTGGLRGVMGAGTNRMKLQFAIPESHIVSKDYCINGIDGKEG